MSIRFNTQVSAILEEAAMKLGELGYYARIEPGLVPASGEGVITLNVASSLIGLARVEELFLSGQANIQSQTSKLGLLKFIARSQDRSQDPDFVAGVVGPRDT
ncbi:hypothetical protein [Rhodoferax fermentans]|uniref:Uncharacterized protein n=1 Tax=Rhodoferax fermentans TaxID=28066 RepID=A0A1T1ANG9_RHOFE|nr:hypothetical protein [Rhodoferax fermentans]MBK1684488.1 hypothetical protein [Rhodoferax fermentans]OOV05513.1 hypothetical protein RF819_01260 [Rhodoferax fermentans]